MLVFTLLVLAGLKVIGGGPNVGWVIGHPNWGVKKREKERFGPVLPAM